MKNRFTRLQNIFEQVFPWFVLAILVAFTYAYFVRIPSIGFAFSRGEVTLIESPGQDNSLQVDDQLIRVGQVEMADFLDDLNLTIFDGAGTGDVIPIVVERDGKTFNIDWVIPAPDSDQLLERFNSLWWLPYVFWMAGMATLLLIRPKDLGWKLLAAFNFLTALWLSAGNGLSRWHIWKSGFILTSVIWLCLPVYLHLHWLFPSPLKKLPKFVWGILYLLGIGLSIAEWFQALPPSAFYGGFAMALIGSIVLLIVHAVTQSEFRRDIFVLGVAVALMVLPSIGASLASMLGIKTPGFVGGSFLTFSALPGAYFFVTYRRQFLGLEQRVGRLTRVYLAIVIGGVATEILLSLANFRGNLSESTLISGVIVTLVAAICAITAFSPFLALPALTGDGIPISQDGKLEIRANRLLSIYLFTVLLGLILSVGIIISNGLIRFSGGSTITGILAAILGIIITASGFGPFQRWVDRHVLNINLPQESVLKAYADRITTSLDDQSLIQFFRGSLLPSLLVRQSVLLRINAGDIEQFIKIGVNDSQIPTETDIPDLMTMTGKLLRSTDLASESFSWIRLILPLQIRGEYIGLWLLGRRDPDDFYAQSEILILEALANQTAIALVNIEQTKRLHTLYQTDIDRNEDERTRLARELHDDVLGQLALLSMQTGSTDSPKFQDHYHQVTSHLRQILNDLRPAMLNYGLFTALEEYIDELVGRIGNQPSITLKVLPSTVRYDLKIEKHLFRIIQQACENAVRHARAANIRVDGSLEPKRVHLIVEDDGVGFRLGRLDFDSLLSGKHFGLVGMMERAAIINASLRFSSEPGHGSKVSLDWTSD